MPPPRSDITEVPTSEPSEAATIDFDLQDLDVQKPLLKHLNVLKGLHDLDGLRIHKAEYVNYSELVEVVGTLLLPHCVFKNLKILLDIGATSNFINQNLVQNAEIALDVSKSPETILIGDGNEAKSSGETKPIVMKIGKIFKHTSTYTVMELGEYDLILGMPFFRYSRCTISFPGELPEVKVTYKRRLMILPLRTDPSSTVKCFHVSRKDFELDSESSDEIFQIHYSGWRTDHPKPETECNISSPPPRIPVDHDTALAGLFTISKPKPNEKIYDHGLDPKSTVLNTLDQIPRQSGIPELEALLLEFKSVFPEDLPKNVLVDREIEMRIPLRPGFEPSCQAPYCASHEAQEMIEKTVKYLYDHGFARDSLSEFGAPVTLAKKSDGTWRFCVDYRKLNAMTKEAKFPLPRIEDCLDKLGKASYFSKIDLRSGYWQVKVHPDDIEKTAFRTQSGHHEFTVVPFGLQGAPSTFQRLMHHYLRPYLGKFCLVYIDDILIYSNSAEEHLEHIKIILNVLREKVLYAKGTKCDFFRKKIAFLGFVIENHSISTDPAKIEAIRDWPEPETVREVRSFLGLANFYRKFIHHHSTIAKPLTDLLKSTEFAEKFGHKFTKTAKLVLGEKEKIAFQSLKDALISAPCLIIYDPTKPTEIWGDASFDAKCVGAVLMQDHGNGFQPCCYLSKVLNTAESHYPTFEQELLALKKGMEQ